MEERNTTGTAPTICLAMIVRNESKIIERCIESALPIIDTFCIIDTGSTDDTVVRLECLRETHDMPDAQIHLSKFVNFEVNRTEAVQRAAAMADYTLLLDADFVLCVDTTLFHKELLRTCDQWNMEQHHGSGGLSYYNTRIVSNRSGVQWKYKGVTHEYITHVKGGGGGVPTKGALDKRAISIHDLGDGGCKEHKFTRDYELLTQGLHSEPDNLRYKFYLAQTCKDLKKWDEAVYWYSQCLDRNWIEERYYARYQMGVCMRNRGDPEHRWMEALLKAHSFCPQRHEALCDLVQWCQSREHYHMGASFARAHQQNEKCCAPNKHASLFLDTSVYAYKFADVSLICAVHAKDQELTRQCAESLMGAWQRGHVPDAHRKRIAGNLRFALQCDTVSQVYERIKQHHPGQGQDAP